jgi:ketosteroid isomerase-like protein
VTIDYQAAASLLARYGDAWQGFDGDAWVALFTEDAEYHEDPFGDPFVGHNALRAFLLRSAERQRDVDFTVERHWVSGETVLARWHASWFDRSDGHVVRIAGFLTAAVAGDGRISTLYVWSMSAPSSAGSEGRTDGR